MFAHRITRIIGMTTNKKMTQELNDKNNSKRESLLKLLCNMQDI